MITGVGELDIITHVEMERVESPSGGGIRVDIYHCLIRRKVDIPCEARTTIPQCRVYILARY